jgi:hypothetical protein
MDARADSLFAQVHRQEARYDELDEDAARHRGSADPRGKVN